MAKISAVECAGYEQDKVQKAVDRTFENLGGIDRFVKSGDRVFLKLNLVIKKSPEVAATTHPSVVEAVARRLVEAGARVIIGDSPGGPYTKGVLQSLYKVCGIDKAAENAGAELNYDCSEDTYHHADGVAVKLLTLTKPMMECDKIITITKMKTHGMTMYTGAVKVMFGAVPGVLKAEYHYKMRNLKDFSNILVDICTLTKPMLSIIDGIVGMEGEGPTAGTPVESNVLLASENPYELDVAGSYLMGITPSKVPTIQRCMERGLTDGNINSIEVVGDPLEKFKKVYRVPEINTINFSGRLPGGIEKFLKRNVLPRPVFSQEVCIGCSNCKRACPPGAITMINGKPRVNLDECIRCFCCQELCPQKAVNIKRPWILRRFLK
jgi:Uncharacterized conserved protein